LNSITLRAALIVAISLPIERPAVMSIRTSRVAIWMQNTLFALGILISLTAWFVDRAQSFPRILHLIAPDYVALHDAFQILDQGEKAILPIDHPGAALLLRSWEPAPAKELHGRISAIGRSTGVFNIITGVHHYELRLLTQNNEMMLKDHIWKDTQAKELMQRTLDSSLVGWSFGILLFGMLLTIAGFAWDRLN